MKAVQTSVTNKYTERRPCFLLLVYTVYYVAFVITLYINEYY